MACDTSRLALWHALGLTFGLVTLHVPPVLAADALRVLVRVASDNDRALLPRLYGQLSDVDAQLISVETAPLEATLATQLEAAQQLAARHAVDAVLWFSAMPAEPDAQAFGMLMQLATPGNGRILTRRLLTPTGAQNGKLASSLLEMAALAARSVLRAISAGSTVGIPTEQALDEATTPASLPEAADTPQPPDRPAAQLSAAVVERAETQPAVPPALPTDTVEESAAASAPAQAAPFALHVQLFVGVQGALDGRSSLGQHGLYARAGLGTRSLVVCVYAVASLASSIEDPYFSLRVARHAVGVALELRSALGAVTKLGLGAHAGAALLERSSQAKSTEVISYPASLTAALTFGPEVALRWIFGHFGLGLRLALDILPSAPRFETAPGPQGSSVSHTLWALQPRLALGMEAALP